MDPNVTGRFCLLHDRGPEVQKIVVLDLTEETHGNANGIGAADVTTQAVLDAVRLRPDVHQCHHLDACSQSSKLPIVMPTKRSAVAIATLNGVPDEPGSSGSRTPWSSRKSGSPTPCSSRPKGGVTSKSSAGRSWRSKTQSSR